MNPVEFTNEKAIFIVTDEENKIYSFEMNWQDAQRMTNFLNSTYNGKKFSFREIEANHKIIIK